MADFLEVLIEDGRWRGADFAGVSRRAARAALEAAGIDPGLVTVSALGCDDSRISGLNKRFRGRSGPTNVLSFPAFPATPESPLTGRDLMGQSSPVFIGDIAVAYETVSSEASSLGLAVSSHLAHLVAHGCLHMLGYDHESDADARVMESLEAGILEGLGIPSPYAASGRVLTMESAYATS